jgi:hydroxymethylpyrimidine pyrophosphatase-like HAD family hydrolase
VPPRIPAGSGGAAARGSGGPRAAYAPSNSVGAVSAFVPHLVALDIDGTTIDHSGHLTEAVRDAVRAVADAGHHVVIATGRAIVGTQPILAALALERGYAVCSNGAVTIALDPGRRRGYELLEAVTFDPRPALDLLHGSWPDAVVAVEEIGVGFKVSAPFPEGELEGQVKVVPWEELGATPVTRLTFRSPSATTEDFVRHAERIGLHGFNYGVGYTAWLDINPEGVSKASALEQVRRRLHVEPGHTLAVGDQRNDLEMLAWAARGVAMGNAPDEVKAVADEVTGDVADDGLVPVLRSLLP